MIKHHRTAAKPHPEIVVQNVALPVILPLLTTGNQFSAP